MKTQADKKSVKDIQELKQRFTKFSIGLFAILTLSITLLASAYTYILQKSYTDIALETELKRDMENADAIHKLANKKKSEEKNLPRSAINLMKIQKCITRFPRF